MKEACCIGAKDNQSVTWILFWASGSSGCTPLDSVFMDAFLFNSFIYFTNLFIYFLMYLCLHNEGDVTLLQSLFYVFCWRAQLTTVMMMLFACFYSHSYFYILKRQTLSKGIISHAGSFSIASLLEMLHLLSGHSHHSVRPKLLAHYSTRLAHENTWMMK